MIKRVVKLTFREDKVPEFRALFEERKQNIRAFEGCEYLELLQDRDQAHVFFTLSYWKDEASLQRYRQSEMFQATWRKTRQLFSGRPEAWSLETASKTV